MASEADRGRPDSYGVEYHSGGGIRRFVAELLGEPPRMVLPYPAPPYAPPPPVEPSDRAAPPAPYPVPAASVDRLGLAWRGKWWILLVALIAGGGAYAGCTLLAPTYESTATLRIVVQSGTGVSQDAVLASNDLATQYAPLVRIAPVIGPAATLLGVSGGTLSTAVSAGTVGDQNLIAVSARAPSADGARQRANAVARQFVTYIRASNRKQVGVYTRGVGNTITPLEAEIATLQAQLAGRPAGAASAARAPAADVQATLASLLAAHQRAAADLAQGVASSQPQVSLIGPAGTGSQVQPKPLLYALVAAAAAFLLTMQLVVVVGARRLAAVAR